MAYVLRLEYIETHAQAAGRTGTRD